MTNKKKLLIGVGSIITALTLYFVYDHLTYITTDNAQIESNTVLLASKVGGFVVEVKVTEGQKVKEGDVLIEIDDCDYRNTLKQIKGELNSLDAKLKDAEKNNKRLTELFQKGAISQQQFDSSNSLLAEIKAKHNAIEAQVAQAELNLENTKIKAPMDGIVAKKSAEKGQLAAPGSPLIGFVGSKEKWVTANFKETDIAEIRIGAPVIIEVDALNGKKIEGQVGAISSATGATFTLLPPDNATGNFTKVVQRVPVRIQFKDASLATSDELRAGLSVIAKVRRH